MSLSLGYGRHSSFTYSASSRPTLLVQSASLTEGGGVVPYSLCLSVNADRPTLAVLDSA
jgi:hypothetical protein